MVIPSLHEDETPGRVDEVARAPAIPQVLANLPSRVHSVSAHVAEDLLDGAGPRRRLERQRFHVIDSGILDFASAMHGGR